MVCLFQNYDIEMDFFTFLEAMTLLALYIFMIVGVICLLGILFFELKRYLDKRQQVEPVEPGELEMRSVHVGTF